MQKNVLVVGVPRSGTSMTSAVFARKGYNVGWISKADERLGDERNPFGYFEADDVIARNVELFRRVGFSEDNTWLRAMIGDEQIAELARLEPSPEDRKFVEEYDARSPWLWKDPRLCLTLPYWWKVMDPERTAVVLVRRPHSEVLQSFRIMRWYGSAESDCVEALYRIDRHLRAAERTIVEQGIPHVEVDYREYFRRPMAVARRLSALTGADISPSDLNIQKRLNHASLRGRAAARLRVALDTGPLHKLRPLRRAVPRSLLRTVFPEKRFLPSTRRS